MKIHILFEFQDGPWGGGNQFLKALKNEFIQMNVYEEDIYKADAILFNSHHLIEQVKKFKREYPYKIFIHRVDGPVQIVRGFDEGVDDIIFKANRLYADGTIFQSKWIKNESEKLGLKINKNYKIIINAPDSLIFNKNNNSIVKSDERIKLIATSWSGNIRKGFDVYQWLDDNLDFNKYEMTFVGNSPVTFKNIIHKQPMNSHNLANELRRNHIYITASKHEPCSNALIEAMHCGLPAVAYNNGGNPDIVGKAGELFLHSEEIEEKLKKIVDNYECYKKNINLPNISQVSQEYYDFMLEVHANMKFLKYNPKVATERNINKFKKYLIDLGLVQKSVNNKVLTIIEKLQGFWR